MSRRPSQRPHRGRALRREEGGGGGAGGGNADPDCDTDLHRAAPSTGEGAGDAGEVLQEDGGGGGDVPGDRQGLLQPVQGDTRSEALDLPQELHQPEVRLGNVACVHPSPLLDILFVR